MSNSTISSIAYQVLDNGKLLVMERLDESTLFHDFVAQRRNKSIDIAIIVVVEGTAHQSEYVLAQNTLQCYARLHSYPLYFLDITTDPTYGGHCHHKDFMFKRHCVVSHFMTKFNHTWYFFLDGDIGVINPIHFLEEYLPSNDYSMLFYKRIMNHEISSGSYFARNDEFSRKFLLDWAGYEYKVPNSFHGTDNGAIHSAVADLIVPGDAIHRNVCTHLWSISTNFGDLANYTVCLQLYLEKYTLPHIKILEKDRQSYSRDGWLTNSAWSPKDFMFHGWQLSRKEQDVFAAWHPPIVEEGFDLEKCSDPYTARLQWRYKDAFLKTDAELDEQITDYINWVAEDFRNISKRVEKLLLQAKFTKLIPSGFGS